MSQDLFYFNADGYAKAQLDLFRWERVLNSLLPFLYQFAPLETLNDLYLAITDLRQLFLSKQVEATEDLSKRQLQIRNRLEGLNPHQMPRDLLAFENGKLRKKPGYMNIIRLAYSIPCKNEKQKSLKSNTDLVIGKLNEIREVCNQYGIIFSMKNINTLIRERNAEFELNDTFFNFNKHRLSKII